MPRFAGTKVTLPKQQTRRPIGRLGGPYPSGQPTSGISFPASTQANPFGSTDTFGRPSTNTSSSFAPKNSTFGSSISDSSSTLIFNSPFSSSSPNPFGLSTTTPVFGSPTASGFGLSTSPSIFGGATSSGSFSSFGSSLTFGNTQSTGLFQSSTPSLGQTPALFGQPSTGFRQTTLGFGSNPFSTPSTGFGNLFSSSTPSMLPAINPVDFGQTTPHLSMTFQMVATPQTLYTFSNFGQLQPAAQTTMPTFGSPGFGQSTFGAQPGGSRVAPYTPTPEADSGSATQPAGMLESISAMLVYKDKSHEELRWEDYQRGDKGGPNPFGQPTTGISFPGSTKANPFGFTGTFGLSSTIPSSSCMSSNLFTPENPTFGSSIFDSSSTSIFNSPFSSSSPNPFGSSTTSPVFGSSTASGFGLSTSPSIFGGATSSPSSSFGSSLTFGNTQSSGLLQSSSLSLGHTPSLFAQPSTGFQQTTPGFGSNPFSTPSTGFGSLFSSLTPSMLPTSNPPSLSMAFQMTATPQTSNALTFSNFGQSQPGGFGSILNQGMFGQSYASFPVLFLFIIADLNCYNNVSFGSQTSPFAAHTTMPTFGSLGFGQSTFGGQPEGSGLAPYSPTPEADSSSATQPAAKLESISAMSVYKDKSHEELRWEDYQRVDKGGPKPAGQPTSGISFPASTPVNPFGSTDTFGRPSTNPSSYFAPKNSTFGSSIFDSSTSIFNSPFSSSSPNPFGSSTTTPVFGSPAASGFGLSTSPSIFGGATSPRKKIYIFGGATSSGSFSSFGSSLTFGNTQSSGLFQSSTPSLGQIPSLFGPPSTGFQQTTPGFGSNPFSTPSTGFGSLFSSSTPSMLPTSNPVGFSQTTPSLSMAFQMTATPQTSNPFAFSKFGQSQPAALSGFGSILNR